jgi:uncharacterized membrane protein
VRRTQRAQVHLAVGATAGTAVGLVAGLSLGWAYAPPTGWDVAGLVFLGWTWATVAPMNAAATASHATDEDPTKRATHVILVSCSIASLISVGYLLLRAGADGGATRILVAALGVSTIVMSWLVIHTVFALRYAVLYYTPPAGGVDFGKDAEPRYVDFAYLAFTIGMTFQVSDTAIARPGIRMTVLRQALISFVFGSVILATAVNLVASLASDRA